MDIKTIVAAIPFWLEAKKQQNVDRLKVTQMRGGNPCSRLSVSPPRVALHQV
jgi:hypothetical protein